MGKESLLDWCHNHGEQGEKIEKEFTGKDSDGNTYNINSITPQSNKDLIWVCSKNHKHIWQAKVQKRTILRSNCPYCSNQRIIAGENDLETWCKNNNKQYLIDEFMGEDENGNKIEMNSLAKSTHIKVKWGHKTIDGELHEWYARVSDRTNKNSKCPICNRSNTVIKGKNDLETWCNKDIIFGNILKEQWTGLTTNGKLIYIADIASHSHKKLIWLCECGDVFIKSPLQRLTDMTYYCRKCNRAESKRKRNNTMLNKSISLDKWCNKNSLKGVQIRKEFTGITEDKEHIDIKDITYGSSKYLLWRHTTINGEVHEWYATVYNRTYNNSNCPHCNNKGTSLPEQIIYRCIKQVYPDTINRGKFQGYEFDITIPDIKVCIEYNGVYYHKNKKERDLKKRELCDSYNVKLIIIDVGNSTNPVENEIWEPDHIVINMNRIEKLIQIIEYITHILNINMSSINYNTALLDSIKFMNNIG